MGSDGPLKAPHLQAAPTVFDANLFSTAGDGESLAMLVLHIEQLGQGANTTEGGSLVIDAATPAAGVVVDAPAVRANHGQIGALLLVVQGRQGISPFLRSESATGSTVFDAGPLRRLSAHD